MLLKAVVESIVDAFHVKVRVPLLDRDTTSSVHTSDGDLYTATICSMPNCRLNLRVGDVVFVAIEKTYPVHTMVVIGVLFREAVCNSYCDIELDELNVRTFCSLPRGTTLGDVSYKEIRQLLGVKDNLQEQINALSDRISMIEGDHPTTGGDT
jgi:hypothetical protein